MRKIGLALLLGSLVGVPTVGAAKKRTYQDEVTASVHKSGRQGTAIIYKGTVNSKVFGKGKVKQWVYGNLDGKFEITYDDGKTFGTTTAKIDPQGGGRVKVTGTYKLTRGTGRFQGVKGQGTYRGSADSDLQRARFTQRGPVTF